MTETGKAQVQKKKAPKIVTWLSVAVAAIMAFAKIGETGATGGTAFSSFAATFFVHFLVVYFVLWATAKIVRKVVGEEKKTVLNISTVVVAALLFFVFSAMSMATDAESEGGLHACVSESAVAALKSTLENSAVSNLVTIEVIDMADLRELFYSEEDKKRACMGEVVLNTGRAFIRYDFTFAKSDPNQVLIEVKEVDEDTYARMRMNADYHDKNKEGQDQTDASSTSGQ